MRWPAPCGWRCSSRRRTASCRRRSRSFADEYPALRVEVTEREPESALFEVSARDFDLVIAEQYPGHAAPRLPTSTGSRSAATTLRLAAAGDAGDRRRLGDARDGGRG